MSVSFDLSVLYRGPLASCNYACVYCPFAKSESSPSELAKDRAALERFVRWVEAQKTLKLGILITPWGEALIRDYYRDAIVDLSHFDSVRKIAIQTNLSCRLDWLEHAHRPSVGLWCTYHPSQTRRSDFVAQCRKLDALDVRYSVGVVGLKEHLDAIEALRAELPASVYLWVNAYKRDPSYYEVSELDFLGRIDPHFAINNQRHRSFGESCRAGEHAVSVDGAGNLRRCHFIEAPIGNIYEPGWARALRPRNCSETTCGCHIGYTHLDRLKLYDIYGDGILERIPKTIPAKLRARRSFAR